MKLTKEIYAILIVRLLQILVELLLSKCHFLTIKLNINPNFVKERL
jgi:hypothetical protein